MHTPASPRLVALRASALAAVATISGLAGHLHAGGEDPGPARVLVVWGVAAVLSAAFLIREVGWLRIVLLLLAEQLLVHAALMWLASGSTASMPMAPMPDMPGMAGMRPAAMSVLPSGRMVLAHALAAVLAGMWLWRGERALWSLIALTAVAIRMLVWALPVGPAEPPSLRGTVLGPESFSWWGSRIAREVPRRGPPGLAAL